MCHFRINLTLMYLDIGAASRYGEGASISFISAHRLSVELVRSVCNDNTETAPTKRVGHVILLHGGTI